MKPALARLAGEAGAIAVMLWLMPASVQISSWPSTGPVRIAYLAPLSRLYLSVLASVAAVGVLAWLWRTLDREVDDLARALTPALSLWLWTVPFLPWLADRAPLLIILAGPVRWTIAAAAAAGVLVNWQPALITRLTRGPGLRRSIVFLISLALYATLGLRSVRELGFGGDEPHYLIITQSLLADRDLDIANNHERREYRSFFPGELRPDFLRRGRHGEIYSIHAPGLPALILPAYAAAGARGAVLFVALLGALTALALFDLASTLAGPAAGAMAWVATCLSVPFIPHAWLIYPELPGALIVAWAALWLYEPTAPPRALFLHGVALSVLPWLHTKFVVFVAAFTLFEVQRMWPRLQRSLPLIAPIAISGALWLLSFYWMYGEFDPEAPYGTYTRMFVLAANIPRGALGLLFDQKFGLLAFSPVYALAGLGMWLMLRDPRHRLYAAELTLTAVAFFISTTRLYMWWGGSSPPARFMVPMVPLLAPMIAVAAAQARGLIARTALVSTLILTVGLAAITLSSASGRLLYSDPHGVSSLVKAIQGSAPLDVVLPTFTEENWRAPFGTLLIWFGAVAVVTSGLVVCARRRVLSSVFWTATAGATSLLLLVALAFGVRPPANRRAVTLRGQLSLMREYDPSRLRTVDVTHMRRLNDGETLRAATLILPRTGQEEVANPRVLEGPFELPEGSYQARVWFSGDAAPAAEAFVALSDDVVLARMTELTNPTGLRFDLPVRTPAFVGLGDAAAARAVSRVEILPLAIVPHSSRDVSASHVVEPVGGAIQGYMAYGDDHTYPEKGVFWTRDTEKGSVVVVTSGASTLRLVLHVGPPGGSVGLDVGGTRLDVELRPDETRELSFPLTPGTRRVGVSVRASRSFRPADVDPRSDDNRLLGCQVRPLLS